LSVVVGSHFSGENFDPPPNPISQKWGPFF
jgi:hypothetical protein